MENLPRPAPPRSIVDRASDWITWFGLGRLAMSAGAVAVVAVGAFWLTRAPQPPTEAALPRATAPPSVAVEARPPAGPATDPAGSGATASGAAADARVSVHVAGAVDRPGVYELPAGARVADAVEAAGGATPDADPHAVNLAAPVPDGSQVYVPTVGEEAPPPWTPASPAVSAAAGPVDVNRATAAELDELPGVGPATAAAIVVERERNGPFVDVDDLDRVPGIGPAKLATLRDLVTT